MGDVDDDGWEARMAERAKERAAVREAEEIARRAAEVEAGRPAFEETVAAYLARCYPLTVDEARAVEPFACACMGPPTELCDYIEAPCRCQLMWMKVRELLGDNG